MKSIKETAKKLIMSRLPKDDDIINGIICDICKEKLLLENYESKEQLREYATEHFLKHLYKK